MIKNSFSRSDFSNLPFEDNKKKSFNKNNIQKNDFESLVDEGSSLIDSGNSGSSLEEGFSCDICEKVESISEKLCDMQEDLSSVKESLTLDYDCLGQETIMKQSRDMREEIGNCGEKSICEILQDNDCGLCEIKSEIKELKEILDLKDECDLEEIICGIDDISDRIGSFDRRYNYQTICENLDSQFEKLNCMEESLFDLQAKMCSLKDVFLAFNSAISQMEIGGSIVNYDSSLLTNSLNSFCD